MRLCDEHFEVLRSRCVEHGLEPLFVDGETAKAMLVNQFETAEESKVNFDPLTAGAFAVMGNAVEMITGAGENPLELMGPDAVEPCPVCFLNQKHFTSCPNPPECPMDLERGFDWMPAAAADDALAKARELELVA